nr:hypothetical protein [Tanacetum cinerariifolium]
EVATYVVPPTLTSPSPSSPVIPSSPPHQPPCPPQPQDAEGSSLLFQQVLNTCAALALRVEGLENDKAAQQLEIVKLKARMKKLEKINKVKSSKLRRLKKAGTSQRVESSDDVENVFNQGRIIVDMDQDEGIELVTAQEKDAEVEGRHADKQVEIYNIDLDYSLKVLSMQEDDTEVQEAVEVVTTAKLMTEVVTTAATQVVAASTPIPAAKPKILTITAAPAVSTRRRKGVVIRDPKEELSSDTPAETPKTNIADLSIHTTRYISPTLTQKVFANMRRIGKGFSGVETPFFESMLVVRDVAEEAEAQNDKAAQQLEIVKLKARVKKLEKINMVKSSKLIRLKKAVAASTPIPAPKPKILNIADTPAEPQYIKRYHGMKKKPQTESEARKNMIFYLKNTEGYKMDFFKGMKYDEILPIFQAKFDANIRFLFKSRKEMEEED